MSPEHARAIALAVASEAVMAEGDWLLYRDYDVAKRDQAAVKKALRAIADQLARQSDEQLAQLRSTGQDEAVLLEASHGQE
jgi:hypothetical protein